MNWIKEKVDGIIAQFKTRGANLVFVDESSRKMRIGICESNVCEKFDAEKRKCKSCGCFMDWKTKLKHDPFASAVKGKIAETECPEGYW